MLKRFLHQMKIHDEKSQGKIITITAERLSDHSRITFNFSTDQTIEQLRHLLNHHLPPKTSKKFFLYSYQRGARIHFHPSSFKLDFFPVIFDQSVLLLQMDDSTVEQFYVNNDEYFANEIKSRRSFISKSSRQSSTSSFSSNSSTNTQRKSVTCTSILRSLFQRFLNPKDKSQISSLLTS